jgi:purine-cytosine permease-like protein
MFNLVSTSILPKFHLTRSLRRSSAGLTIGTWTTGLLGPNSFNLTFNQTCAIIWGVGALGSAVSAYVAIFGKKNGLRALINTRFVFGYYSHL